MPISPVLYLDNDILTGWNMSGVGGTHNSRLGISGASDSTFIAVTGPISPATDRYGIQDSPVDAVTITAINCQARSLYVDITGGTYAYTFYYYNGITLVGTISFDRDDGEIGNGAYLDSPIKSLTGLSLSKAEFDALQVELMGVAGTGATERIRIAEIWHTVAYDLTPPSGGVKICVNGEFKTSEQGSGSFNTQQNVGGSFLNHPLNVGGQFATSQAVSGEFKTALSVQGSIPDCD